MTDYDDSVGPLMVLVVEDGEDARESLALLLDLWGHVAVSTGDGHEAVRLAARHLPDIALIDLGLPGLSGFEVARRVRRIPGLEHLCLIALTGYADAATVALVEEAGFHYHFAKPYNPVQLDSVLVGCAASAGR